MGQLLRGFEEFIIAMSNVPLVAPSVFKSLLESFVKVMVNKLSAYSVYSYF